MSQLTNFLNLPQPIVDAVKNDSYNAGECHISVTKLIAPTKYSELTRRHQDEMVEDVSDRIYALFGSLGHLMLERAAGDGGGIVEKRFFAERMGWKLSGQADFVMDGGTAILTDYKFCAKAVAADGPKREWTEQLNILRWLASQNGIEVKEMEIVAIYRDWSKLQALKNKAYPQYPVERFPIDMWPMENVEAFIDYRLKLHQEARATQDDDMIPECSASERWQDPPIYAVKKKATSARAEKNGKHTSKEEADKHAASIGGIVEFRPSEPIRCLAYCAARKFCHFGRTVKGSADDQLAEFIENR